MGGDEARVAANRVCGVGVGGRVARTALGLVYWYREAWVYVAAWGLARRKGRACRREKGREGERGLECRWYSERSEAGAGVVFDSCVVRWPDPANVDAGAYSLACAVGEDGDVSVVMFCVILEEHAVVD